ncbi:MAG: HlyD family type I secretion periplasmic adaptor subunit [Alphaproteobacteria bacterium]
MTAKNPKREKQTRYLSQAIQLEEAVNPHIIRATMVMVSLALLAFIVWASFTNINEIARTPGEVIPHGYQQTVQHLEGGIIKNINVQEGDIVKSGQILVTIDETIIKKDLQRAKSKQLSLEKQAERLRAFIENREPDFTKLNGATESMIADQKLFFESMRNARKEEEDVIRDQITQKKQSIHALKTDLATAESNYKIAQDMHSRRKQLNKKGYASDMQLLDDERNVNQAKGEIARLKNQILVAQSEIKEFKTRLASLSASHRDNANEKLDQILAEKEQNTELIHKLEKRIERLQIRAPTQGMVKGINVNTIGAIIQPGFTIMEIVPLGKRLEVTVKISPQDIGHLKPGQSVQIKFSSFDFSRYGSVKGTLDQISASTFGGENGERYYQGRVLLNKNYVGNNPENIVMPGMTVMADIITGKKTILQYMLKPIHISLKTAFTER